MATHICRRYHCHHQPPCHQPNILYLSSKLASQRSLLPADEQHWLTYVNSGCIDSWSLNYLTLRRIINWCTSFNLMYPLRVTGDGNCLMNAVCTYIRAEQDYSMKLRNFVYENMANYPIASSIRSRWQREREWQNSNIPDGGLQFTEEEWDSEWNKLVQAAVDKPQKVSCYNTPIYEYLEEIHVFVLANILRRPIIILAEPFMYGIDGRSIEQNNLIGIYLPLLWPPEYCWRVPVVLAFIVDHFMPLILRYHGDHDYKSSSKDAVPLVTADLEPMRIHFLLPDEEGSIANMLLQQFLVISEEEVKFPGSTEIVLCSLIDEDMSYLYCDFESFYPSVQSPPSQLLALNSNSVPQQTTKSVSSTSPDSDQYSGSLCKSSHDQPASKKFRSPVKTLIYSRDDSCADEDVDLPVSNIFQSNPLRDINFTLFQITTASDGDASLSRLSKAGSSGSSKLLVLLVSNAPSTQATNSRTRNYDNMTSEEDCLSAASGNFKAITDVDESEAQISDNNSGQDDDQTSMEDSNIEVADSCQMDKDIHLMDAQTKDNKELCQKQQPLVDGSFTQNCAVMNVKQLGLCAGPHCSQRATKQLRGLCLNCYRTLLNTNFNNYAAAKSQLGAADWVV